jgi:hypothetical protein
MLKAVGAGRVNSGHRRLLLRRGIMARLTAAIMLPLLLISPGYGQSRDHSKAKVQSMRRVAKVPQLKNKPAVEIVVGGVPYYIGGLYFCLQIGQLQGIREWGMPSGQPPGIVFFVPMEDWRKLKGGEPMWLSWGCREPSVFEKLEPFANLDKKVLKK